MHEGLPNSTQTRHKFSISNYAARAIWQIAYILFYRPFSLRVFRKWRVLLIKMFGGKIAWTCTIHSSVKIWAPWNLVVGDYSCIGPEVDCYNQGKVKIGSNTTISQKVYICASSHDYSDPLHPLILCPIEIGDKAWVAAGAFLGPHVFIGEGAVIGACSVVTKEMPAWTVCAGNPCKPLKPRVLGKIA